MKIIKSEWLNLDIHVFKTFKEYQKVCNKNGFETLMTWEKANDGLAIHEQFDGINYFSIIMDKMKIPLVVHESSHLVDYIFDFKGIPISINNTETRAYFLSWLVKKIMEVHNVNITSPENTNS